MGFDHTIDANFRPVAHVSAGGFRDAGSTTGTSRGFRPIL